ncbi:hypothetical protein AUP68_10413 [Ilyonectria robusta]
MEVTARALLARLASHNEQSCGQIPESVTLPFPPFREEFDTARDRRVRGRQGLGNEMVIDSFPGPRVLLGLPRWIGQDASQTFCQFLALRAAGRPVLRQKHTVAAKLEPEWLAVDARVAACSIGSNAWEVDTNAGLRCVAAQDTFRLRLNARHPLSQFLTEVYRIGVIQTSGSRVIVLNAPLRIVELGALGINHYMVVPRVKAVPAQLQVRRALLVDLLDRKQAMATSPGQLKTAKSRAAEVVLGEVEETGAAKQPRIHTPHEGVQIMSLRRAQCDKLQARTRRDACSSGSSSRAQVATTSPLPFTFAAIQARPSRPASLSRPRRLPPKTQPSPPCRRPAEPVDLSTPDDSMMPKRNRETDYNEDPASGGAKRRREECESHATELTHSDFTVGWVCALPKEQTAATAMLDQIYPDLPKPSNDPNTYTLGSIGKHNIVIACLPKGKIGNNSTATFATQMVRTFPSIKVGLMVGIGGGIPPKVRLGDVVVSTPVDQYPGVVQWDFGKTEKDGKFKRTGALNSPPSALLTALTKLETNHEMHGSKIPRYLDDLKKNWPKLVAKYIRSESLKDPLFAPDASHRRPGDMCVHYGLIASGNQVIKDAGFRDSLNESLGGNVLCVEMEAAGLMDFPCIVIRGICDYADSQKNKDWQEHAAALAAAFAKELLQYVQPGDIDGERPVRDILSQVCDAVSAIRENTTHTRAKLDRKEDVEILDWLTPIDYGPLQSDYLRRRQPATGNWLLGSEEFLGWLAASKQTLFCPGIPGAGKTILTSIVVDSLNSKFGNDSEIGIAYIYCNFRRQHEQKIDDLLASVLKQLTQCRSSLPESLKNLYDQHKTKRTRPSPDEISGLLQSVAAMYSRVFIIVDALDECRASDGCRTRFLSELFNLQTRHGTNIFATSRFIPEIMDRFETSLSIEIHASPDDVARYLEGHVGQLPSFVQQDRQLQEEITTGISEAVDGMYVLIIGRVAQPLTIRRFLLAQLYLGLLGDKLTLNDIRSAMETFQNQGQGSGEDQVLPRAYGQAMERINGQMPGKKELAMKVLLWITCAKRQLTTSELQHALATKTEKPELDHGDLPHIGDMVSVCAGLVTVDEESGIIRLVHYTTQEYLKRTRERWFRDPESVIAATCVTYLSFIVFETGFCKTDHKFEERLRSNPFYDYAAHNWGHHAPKDKTPSQVISFLTSKAKIEASSQALMAAKRYSSHSDYSQEAPREMTGLHWQDALDRTPLWYAAQNGHEAVVKLLVAAGADVNAGADTSAKVGGGDGRTALQAAAGGGHLEVVKKLLAAGADVNAAAAAGVYGGRTALQAAAGGGHLEVVEKLLAAGADVNATAAAGFFFGGRTALQAAAGGGHLEVVEKLLAAGADVNAAAAGTGGRTALQAAAEGGHLEVVEKLLAAGADVNAITATGDFGRTALQAASGGGHLEVVEKLLAAGADVNATAAAGFIGGRTALQAAAEGGHLEVVEKLLAAGADVNAAAAARGRTALQAAAEGGYLEVVEKLLAAGADVTAAAAIYGGRTALQAAAEGGHLEVVEKLLAAGADVNAITATGDYGRTALQAAAEGGYLEVVEKLLAAGADVNAAAAAIYGGRTALQAAAEGGHLEVVEKLLAAGADVNAAAARSYGRTALQAAAEGGHLEAVEKLLAAGADVNAAAAAIYGGRTALQAAAGGGYLEIINRLKAAGALW